MSEENDKPTRGDTSGFWTGLGWCLIWLGFGGCAYLTHREGPLVQIINNPPSALVEKAK